MRDRLIELFYDNNVHCDQKIEELADDVMDTITESVTVQEWISVKDRLPEERVMVLGLCHTVFESGGHSDLILVMELRYGLFIPFNCSPIRDGSITHWMPLPQPPEEVHS